MKNFKKICQVLLLTVICCTYYETSFARSQRCENCYSQYTEAREKATQAGKKWTTADNDQWEAKCKDICEDTVDGGQIEEVTVTGKNLSGIPKEISIGATIPRLSSSALGVIKPTVNEKTQKELDKLAKQEARAAEKEAKKEAKTAEKEAKQEARAAEKEAKQEARAAEKEAKQIEKINKKINNAQEDIDKFCEGGSKPNANKCQKARQKKQEAEAELKASQTSAPSGGSTKSVLGGGSTTSSTGASFEERQEASQAAFVADKAYDEAVTAYKAAAANLAQKQKECALQQAKSCPEAEKAARELQDAKAKADMAYKEKYAADQKAKQLGVSDADIDPIASSKRELTSAQRAVKDAQDKIERLNNTLAEAQAACNHSQTLTSRQGKADAEKYCGMVETLKSQLADAEQELSEAEMNLEDAEAEYAIQHPEPEHKNQEYMAFSSATGSMKDGTYRGSIDYSADSGNIFNTITRRAARIIVGLKPIVYTFAGFGLIAFAFAAIFNKISWKWFANIAIGLFLVANMGRLIEYMVYPSDGKEQTPQPLSAFGNYIHKGFADTEYAWVESVTPYTPPEMLDKQGNATPDVSVAVPEDEASVRGWCKKTEGATGWGNFTSCIKDIVASGQKAVDAAKKVKNTVDTVKGTVNHVKFAADRIGDAARAIGSGNIENSIRALGDMGKYANSIVGAGGNLLNTINDNTIGVANDIQDINKSRDEQRELAIRRGKGEATGGFTADLMGQTVTRDENGKVTGVERRWSGDMEQDPETGEIVIKKKGTTEGDIASDKKNGQNTGKLGFLDAVDDVVDKSDELNTQYNRGIQTASEGIRAIGDTGFGNATLNNVINGKSNNSGQKDKVTPLVTTTNDAQDLPKEDTETSNPPLVSSQEENEQAAAEADRSLSQITGDARKAANEAASLEREAANAAKKAEAALEKFKKTGLPADEAAYKLAQKEAEMKSQEAEDARTKSDELNAAQAEAQKAADEANLKAAESAVENSKKAKEELSTKVSEAQKALEEAKKNGDESKIKEAQDNLKGLKKQYDEAELAYYKAEADYAIMTEDAQARAEAEKKLTQESETRTPAPDPTPAEQAASAQKDLRTSEREASSAQRKADSLAKAADQAAKDAEAALEKFKRTGLPSDEAAYKLAQKEAEKAAKDAASSKEKAEALQGQVVAAEAAAHEAAVAASSDNVKNSKQAMEQAAEELKTAQKDMQDAYASNDPERIKKAQQNLEKAQNKYDNDEIAYYKAEAKHASLTEDKGTRASSEDKIKTEEEAAKIVAEYEKNNTPSKLAQNAKNELRAAETEASRAAGEASNKQRAAEQAQKAAEEAAKKAMATGLQSDIDAATLAKVKAEQAKKEAEKASQKAQAAKEAVAPLQDKAKNALINEANYLQQKSEAEASQYEQEIYQAVTEENAAQEEFDKARQEAAIARAKAESSRSAEDIVAAKKAADELKAKEKALNTAKQKTEDANKKYNQAILAGYEAKSTASELQTTEEDRANANDKINTQLSKEAEHQKANQIRDTYYTQQASEADVYRAAQLAEQKYSQALSAAKKAENQAKNKQQDADKAKQAAKDAAQKAAKSGSAVDARKAAELAKRAELAQKEADKATKDAKKAQEPLQELKSKAQSTAIEEAKYNQQQAKSRMEASEQKIASYKEAIKSADAEMRQIYAEAQEATRAAQADKENDALVIKAYNAYQQYLSSQQKVENLRKMLDEEISARNKAELEMYSEATRQAELESSK